MLEYFMKVQGRNLGHVKDYPVNGETIKALEVDAEICLLTDEAAKIRLCIENDEVIGMMIYHVIYKCILVIRGLYVFSSFRKHGIGCKLIESVDIDLKRLLFQTYVSRRPAELFEWIRKWNCKFEKIHRDGDIVTYELDWRSKQNGR